MGKDPQNIISREDHNVQHIPHIDRWHYCDACSLYEGPSVGDDMRIHMEGEGLASSGMGSTRGSCDIKSASSVSCSSLDTAASPQAELSVFILPRHEREGRAHQLCDGQHKGPQDHQIGLEGLLRNVYHIPLQVDAANALIVLRIALQQPQLTLALGIRAATVTRHDILLDAFIAPLKPPKCLCAENTFSAGCTTLHHAGRHCRMHAGTAVEGCRLQQDSSMSVFVW